METEKTAKHRRFAALAGRSEWLVAGVGAALIAVSIGGVALKPLAAAAQSVVQSAAQPLPTTSTVTPALTPVAADAAQTFPGRERGERTGPRRGPNGDAAAPAGAPQRPVLDKHLTTDQVRDIVAGHLAMSGNPNLKVGKATAKEDGVVAVEITTKTGSLVATREISTKSGLPAKIQKRIEERRTAMAQRGNAGGEHRGGPREMGRGPMAHMMGRRFAGGHMGGHMRGGRDGHDGDHDLKLTTDQAKKLAEARLIVMGNPHLKVGAVKEKDADTITVDIVAADNSLVSTHEIDRHTGRSKHARA